jgi:Protein of unknown function (DUF3574)
MIETQLYFGQSKPNGDSITIKEWNDFKANYIRKVFNEGSTVVSVTGDWYDTAARKIITEPTYIVIYTYSPSAAKSRQIDSLRESYKTIFSQQAVLRVDKKVKASF